MEGWAGTELIVHRVGDALLRNKPVFDSQHPLKSVYLWLVFWSQKWGFLKILDAASKFVIVIVLAQWIFERNDRLKEKHYRAWSIVNSARGAGGDGGRKDALKDLNDDGMPLSNAPLDQAYLLHADLPKATLNGASLVSSNLYDADLSAANLTSTDLTNSTLALAILRSADLSYSKLINANLISADLSKANLTGANLKGANILKINVAQAIFCHTTMPDGTNNDANCPAQTEKSK